MRQTVLGGLLYDRFGILCDYLDKSVILGGAGTYPVVSIIACSSFSHINTFSLPGYIYIDDTAVFIHSLYNAKRFAPID
jgi:hypothetical protein